MGIEAKNIIYGEYVSGTSGNVKEIYNPASGELVGKFTESTSADVHNAIQSARKAFEDSTWPTAPKLRVRVLKEIHDVIMDNLEYMAEVQTSENGKVIHDSRIELNSAADYFDYYSGLARNISGMTHLPDQNTMSFVV